jgi:hypothetical protein
MKKKVEGKWKLGMRQCSTPDALLSKMTETVSCNPWFPATLSLVTIMQMIEVKVAADLTQCDNLFAISAGSLTVWTALFPELRNCAH